VENNNSYRINWRLLFIAPMAICHNLKILLSIPPATDSLSVFKNMPVLFTSTKNYSASKTLFDELFYEIAGDDPDELFHSKIVVLVMIVGLGNIVFVRQLKLIWQNQKINIKKSASKKQESAFKHCVVTLHTI
jgi:hypothetical protein